MRTTQFSIPRPLRTAAALLATWALAACGDGQPVASEVPQATAGSPRVLQTFDCTASITAGVRCAPARGSAGGASAIILGGNGTFLQLSSSNNSYDPATEIFQVDVTVKNLLNEAIGSVNGVVPDPDGIRVFFHSGPTVTSGTGTATVNNPDGIGDFTGIDQPYFAYHQILKKDSVSAPKRWEFHVSPTVAVMSFKVYVETELQSLLVINEVLTNPGDTVQDQYGEWIEVYNAGTFGVTLSGLLVADSSVAGRRPYHLIGGSLYVAPGEYVVLGNSTNTLINGGAPVDYAYGTALSLANSFDAVKLAVVRGTDTLTLDRAAYASPYISAKNGFSRELKNPALDNSDMDGGNWADAAVSAIYATYSGGRSGRGTPKAQNSAFVP